MMHCRAMPLQSTFSLRDRHNEMSVLSSFRVHLGTLEAFEGVMGPFQKANIIGPLKKMRAFCGVY
jgi:hypothetical protein